MNLEVDPNEIAQGCLPNVSQCTGHTVVLKHVFLEAILVFKNVSQRAKIGKTMIFLDMTIGSTTIVPPRKAIPKVPSGASGFCPVSSSKARFSGTVFLSDVQDERETAVVHVHPWLVVEPYPSEKLSSSVGMMAFPTEWEHV